MPIQNKISWSAPEYKYYEKGTAWYATLVAISVLIVAFFILVQKDYFAAFSLAVISVLVVLFSKHKPETVEVEINDKQVKFGNIVVPHKQIRNFWVVNTPDHRTLNLHTTTYINNLMVIELEDREPEEIREFMSQFVSEHPENLKESFTQKIMHKFKF